MRISAFCRVKRHVCSRPAMPMPGTRVRKADDDLWMEVRLPNTRYDETAYLHRGTEYVGNENKAFNWLIVEHEVDPVIYCHPGR